MFMIEAESVTKYYGSHQALSQLSFTIGKGQVVGFLGPNGAGKSTTMHILTGFLSLSEGNVRINGYDIFEDARKARESVGYLPEQPPLYNELTVAEYLRYICGLKKLKRQAWPTELARVLPMCSLQQVAGRKIAHLSKGFRQRVGLAQALVGQPPLLILDEPTVGLDPQQILEIRKLIQALSQQHTILLSSHILSEIEATCERVLILNQGQLVADDSTANLSRQLKTCQLQLELLTSTPMTTVANPAMQTPGTEQAVESLLAEALASQGIMEFDCHSSAINGERLLDLHCKLPKYPVAQQEVDHNLLEKKSSYRARRDSIIGWNSRNTLAEPVTVSSWPLLQARRDLSMALSQRGFTIVAMQTQQHSLEDVFLNLTNRLNGDSSQTKGVRL